MPPRGALSDSELKYSHLPEQLETLKSAQSNTLESMADSLRKSQSRVAIFETLQQLLPREAPRLIKQAFARGTEQCYLTILDRLVTHISRHHFPINDFDLDYLSEYFPQLPIESTNYDHESDFDQAGLATQIAASISGFYSSAPEWTAIQDQLDPTITIPSCFTRTDHHCKFNYDIFNALCGKHRSPVKNFPTLLRILAHDTDCIFLDVSYDWDPYQADYTWHPKDIATLTAQWKIGQRLHRLWKRTDEQFTQQPELWRTVFQCWEHMCHQTSESPS